METPSHDIKKKDYTDETIDKTPKDQNQNSGKDGDNQNNLTPNKIVKESHHGNNPSFNIVKKKDYSEIFKSFKNELNFGEIGKLLGSGNFGEVRDIRINNKIMAGKIVPMKIDENSGDYVAYDLHGQNIIKITKIVQKLINDRNYYLIIMEKAILRDLGKLSDYYNCHNLLKLIYKPFHETVGDNLIRFYARQIVNAMEMLNRSNLVHFDLKPENLLITYGITIKLSDFSLLRHVDDKERLTIPGGTPGYVTSEYFNKNERVSGEEARKQDYFAFGATLFFLKYGSQMLKYKTEADNSVNKINITNLLIKQSYEVRSGKLTDEDFINFILELISFKPADRPNFEKIYRNKWLNKDVDILNDTFWKFEYDEEKLIMELQKNDFLIEKEKIFNKKPCRFRFKKKF